MIVMVVQKRYLRKVRMAFYLNKVFTLGCECRPTENHRRVSG
jgi:hypothetical protein